jgi:arylsulfatase A-like enzyme
MTRSIPFIAAAVLLAAGGCGDDDEAAPAGGDTRPGEIAATPEGERAAAEATAFAEAVRRGRTHLDLLALAHLADIDRRGLFVDFGTPARMKYTMGRWRNGWGTDGTAGNRTFTRLSDGGSLWFPVDRVEALTARLRLRKVGSTSLVLYLNGQTLRTVELGEGVQTVDVPVPAEHVRAGENELMIRATGTSAVRDEQVSVEIDSIHVLRGQAAGHHTAPPAYGALVGEVGPEGAKRRSLVLPAGTTATYHVDVPANAKLVLGLWSPGESRARISVHPAGGEHAELLATDVGSTWADRALDLAAHAGTIIRLDIEGGVRGDVAVSLPQIVVPLPERGPPGAHAKNAIVLTIDTLRASKLRPYNRETRVRTPVFDAFAADATLFENAQSPENWTKPAVASILTSLFPMTHQTKADASSLLMAAHTLGEIYQQAGFRTATFLANGYVSDRFGFNQGWHHYTNYIRENRSTEAENVFREAARWIEQHRDQRFFVYIQTIDPHVPYDPPDEFLRMYDPSPEQYTGIVRNRMTGNQLGEAKTGRLTFSAADANRLRALHDGEISYHDRELGVFLDKLRELGLYEDTVFVITSDHGEEFDEHGSWGHGHSVYQELLHVPLAVRWKRADAAGLRVAEVVSTMDIGPTILEATGVDAPPELEGRSLLGWLHGAAPPGPAVGFSDFLDDRRVIRAGRWKMILRGNLTWTMFDLETDPGETQQLRYTRILLGQLLGASDRSDWLDAGTGAAARSLPQADSQIDAELCNQLRELGYVDARCDAL